MSDLVTGDKLRNMMREVASPVTVVTAADEDGPRGITIGSFTSVSLEPPLVSFNVGVEASMHGLISPEIRFAVHVLKSDQSSLSDNFAFPDRTSEEQFDAVEYETRSDGTPVLEGVLGVIFCRLSSLHKAGDHSLLICQVEEIEKKAEGSPLLYYQRSYREVGSEVGSRRFEPVKRVSSDSS